MPTAERQLLLDEALISVNKLAESVKSEPLDVYYQIEDCFGCPKEKYQTLEANGDAINQFVIGTKHGLDLQFRDSKTGFVICNLERLQLNNQGHYRIDLTDAVQKATNLSLETSEKSSSRVECLIRTLDEGECMLCPILVLLGLILFVTILERLWHCLSTKWKREDLPQSDDSRSLPEEAAETGHEPIVEEAKEPPIDSAISSENGEAASLPLQQKDEQQEQEELQERQEQREQQEQQEQQEQVQQQHPEELIGATKIHLEVPTDQLEPQRQQATIESEAEVKPRQRVDSLDALRGLTIAGMIYVNYGGAGYIFLDHKAWDGITLADFVFPFFIFSMGASIAISARQLMLKRGKSLGQMMGKILRRSLILLVLGLCLNSRALHGRGLQYLRLSGVLQRFSISYLVVSVMYCLELTIQQWILANARFRPSWLATLSSCFIELTTVLNFGAIYLYVTFYVDYSDSCPTGYIGPGGLTQGGRYANCTGGAAAWLDRSVLGSNHLYNDTEVRETFKTNVTHDPEGILGYTTSILLTMIGLQCGKILLCYQDHRKRLFMFGQLLAIVGLSCATIIVIPVNKRLWSLSFITLTGTCAIMVLLLFYLALDMYRCQRPILLQLLISAGKNALFLYVGHSLLDGMLPWHFAVDESSHMQLMMRLTWSVLLWLLIAHYMAAKRLFIKI